MSTPAPNFVLDLVARAGRPLAQLRDDEEPIPLFEWTSWLRIRSDITGFVPPAYSPEDDELTGFVPPVFEEDGLALLAMTRDMHDLPGEAIGLYHARLTGEELEALRAAVESTPWLDLPRPTGGDIGAPTLTLTYHSVTKQVCRSFSARSRNFLQAIAPLWRRIDAATVRALKSAASSWWLELELDEDPEQPLAMTVGLHFRTRGIGHVVVNDPRVHLRVLVGELDPACPAAAPLPVAELDIPALPEHAPETLVLRPRARFELSLRWQAPRPGAYLVRAVWQDYGGPLTPARAQTPFMPVPHTGLSQLGSGPYPIRGSVFAEQRIDLALTLPE